MVQSDPWLDLPSSDELPNSDDIPMNNERQNLVPSLLKFILIHLAKPLLSYCTFNLHNRDKQDACPKRTRANINLQVRCMSAY